MGNAAHLGNSAFHGGSLGRETERALSPIHLAVVLTLALSAAAGGGALILGGRGLQLQAYLAILAFYTVCSATFVFSRIRRARLQVFEIPVFITGMFLLEFGLIPLRNFVDPNEIDRRLSANGAELVRTLLYVTLGMIAFWIGCELVRRRSNEISGRWREQTWVPGPRRTGLLLVTAGLYAASSVTKYYLLKNHLYSYLGSIETYYENLASVQVLNVVSEFGTLVLIVIAIERFRAKLDPLWRTIFICVFTSELLWGLLSGMKGLVLQNFILVALVSSFVERKLKLRWLVLPFLALIALYPFSQSYRQVVNAGKEGITSFAEGAKAGRQAYEQVGGAGRDAGYSWREGVNLTLQRMDLLTCVAQVFALNPQEASMVKGEVKWYLLPLYPFIPRLLWHNKPILDEGARFTLALRGDFGDTLNAGSSTAVTYPGDLYLQFGFPGILLGMFLFGVVAQWFTNRVTGPLAPPTLFVYTSVYLFGFPYEVGAFEVWTGFLKLLAIVYLLKLAIYGRPPVALRERLSQGMSTLPSY
jgi:hypothetical protein